MSNLQTTTMTHASVKGRFAPTPSGRMHLGNAFSSLMAWLGARSAGGRMVLRIEDLDPRAQSPERAQLLMDDLHWLGLNWDEGPYWQSQRTEIYEQALSRLAAENTLLCYEGGGQPIGQLVSREDTALSLVVGPEGGFDPAEVAEVTAAGGRIATLGPRILRCETAPLAALAVLMERSGNME